MDAVALASVITSGLVGVSGLGVTLRSQRQAAGLARDQQRQVVELAREQRRQTRLEKAYLDALTHVELGGAWARSTYRNIVLAIEDEFEAIQRTRVDRPSLEKRAEVGAVLGAVGSLRAQQAFDAWVEDSDAVQEALDTLVWNHRESGRGPEEDPGQIDVDRLKVAAEREAQRRSVLREIVSSELRDAG